MCSLSCWPHIGAHLYGGVRIEGAVQPPGGRGGAQRHAAESPRGPEEAGARPALRQADLALDLRAGPRVTSLE